LKLYARLIYYLCLTDPTNRFETRPTIVELSRVLAHQLTQSDIANKDRDEQIRSVHWLVQAQHGMMLVNIYNYELLTAIVQHNFLPFLFRKTTSFGRWTDGQPGRRVFQVIWAFIRPPFNGNSSRSIVR
jgi:hypothetical protein